MSLLVAGLLLLAASSGAAAVLGLPNDGSQVNNDSVAGIDPNQSAGPGAPRATGQCAGASSSSGWY